jgi:hypothetical protein
MNILRAVVLLATFGLFAVTAPAAEPARGHHVPPSHHPVPSHGHGGHDSHHDHDWWKHHDRRGWDRYRYPYSYGYPYRYSYPYSYQYTVPYTYQYYYSYPPTYVPEAVENVYPQPLQVLPQPQPLPQVEIQQATEIVPIFVWYLSPGGVWQYHECETPEVVESYVRSYRQLGYEVKVLRADQLGHPGRWHHHPGHHHPGHHHPGHHHPGHGHDHHH